MLDSRPKSIYISQNSKDTVHSAKTLSLEVADKLAQKERGTHHPLKRKVKQFEERSVAKKSEAA